MGLVLVRLCFVHQVAWLVAPTFGSPSVPRHAGRLLWDCSRGFLCGWRKVPLCWPLTSINRGRLQSFSIGIDVSDSSLEFAFHHFAWTTADEDRISSGIRNVGASDDCWLNLIPRQCTRASGESILVAP